jgi:hypothetical protein
MDEKQSGAAGRSSRLSLPTRTRPPAGPRSCARPMLVAAASLALAPALLVAPSATASQGSAMTDTCPTQAKTALALSTDATKKAGQAALAAAPKRYKDLDVTGAKVVSSKLAAAAGPRGREVASRCGKAIQARTVVVELRFPKELPSASLSEGVVFVSRFKSGYQVWEVAH